MKVEPHMNIYKKDEDGHEGPSSPILKIYTVQPHGKLKGYYTTPYNQYLRISHQGHPNAAY